jgi:hypothetical protein
MALCLISISFLFFADEMNPRNRQIFESWSLLQEMMGPASHWPPQIRKLFWTKNIRNFQRLQLATFCYVNRLNPVLCMEWAELLGMLRDTSAKLHLCYLFNKFESASPSFMKYYAYNVTNLFYEYVDGKPVNPKSDERLMWIFYG